MAGFCLLLSERWLLLQPVQGHIAFPLPAVVVDTLGSEPGVHDPLASGPCSAAQA